MNAAANAGTWMARQTAEVRAMPSTRLLDRSGDAIRAAGKLLRDLDPRLIAICARGSSNHAAAFFKYATEPSSACRWWRSGRRSRRSIRRRCASKARPCS